jgi:hypothetical protein
VLFPLLSKEGARGWSFTLISKDVARGWFLNKNILNIKNMIDLITLINKEVSRFMRIWKQTLLPPVITIVLYLLIF